MCVIMLECYHGLGYSWQYFLQAGLDNSAETPPWDVLGSADNSINKVRFLYKKLEKNICKCLVDFFLPWIFYSRSLSPYKALVVKKE